MSSFAALPAADRFASIIGALCRAVFFRLEGASPAGQALLMLVHRRLRRAEARFASLAARYHAGTLRPPRRRPPRAARPPGEPPPDTPAPERPPRQRLPAGNAWLFRLVPMEAAAAGSRLQFLLIQPDVVEVCAAAPWAGRIFRPLAAMLAADLPPALRLPPRPRRPRPRRPRPASSSTPDPNKPPEPPAPRPWTGIAGGAPPGKPWPPGPYKKPGLSSFRLPPRIRRRLAKLCPDD